MGPALRPGDKRFLDEVLIRIRGKAHYLWRTVDQDGHVLDILVQSRRNTSPSAAAAECCPARDAALRIWRERRCRRLRP